MECFFIKNDTSFRSLPKFNCNKEGKVKKTPKTWKPLEIIFIQFFGLLNEN